jgi:hypothetical protein
MAADVVYCGMLVSRHRYQDCDSPTFLELREGQEAPNVYLVIYCAYLEWQHLMSTIPVDIWLLRTSNTAEAFIF